MAGDDARSSRTATNTTHAAPQSVTVILIGVQPLQASELGPEPIPAMLASGDAIAIGMRRTWTPATSARIMTKQIARRIARLSTRPL